MVTLIGATTENPSFELNASLLSRARVMIFHTLDAAAIEKLLSRAESCEGRALPLDPDARLSLVRMADGDGRAALSLAEEAWRATKPGEIFYTAGSESGSGACLRPAAASILLVFARGRFARACCGARTKKRLSLRNVVDKYREPRQWRRGYATKEPFAVNGIFAFCNKGD